MIIESVTKLFEQRIGEWLTQARKDDAAFDKKVAESKKNVEGCCNYILSVVKESKQCGYDDAEIYGMARHYFDEDDIKDPGKQNVQRVIVTGHVDLSESEKAEAMEAAKKQYLAELRKEAEIKEDIRKGNRLETVEVNTRTWRIEQSRGFMNNPSSAHDAIIELVEQNMDLFKRVA